MDQKLRDVLLNRKINAGVGWKKYGELTGVMYTSLFRFVKGEKSLGKVSLQNLAQVAGQNNDTELISALAGYALNLDVKHVEINLN